ncbi:hypothetical protein GBK02_11480 [Dechloromonas sp. TW-R-39-2]|uniref:hypothetical protein n=1 Tax=Dechloromonas sp. TW-R-39-2 TaxID=2654218 RepID=UPI00193D606B|nr:hypothetical protein [Dechloromonas sp. TW-R-39-2]QRM19979.1 hypothetical protein GBK02_11480 [Dechloromonas sp. TW-R-39-2]
MTSVDQLSTDCPTNNPAEGARRLIDGEERVLYDGYWIKTYPVPADTLEAKKRLIEGLTRRLFNHTEHGLNIPGTRLAEAKAAHESETDPARKRVKAAMLAGAYFNRATDIFRRLVELQADGIEISSDDALMRECGQCLLDAMALGRFVLHRSGEEGIDELWGEPFRAFSIPLEDFYESRYIKIGQTMRDIDKIANAMINNFSVIEPFSAIKNPVRDFANAAKIKAENLRTDHDIFEVWSQLVTAAERLGNFTPLPQAIEKRQPDLFGHRISDGLLLIRQGRDLIFYLARARTPMPKSTRDYIERCEVYLNSGRLPFIPAPLPA